MSDRVPLPVWSAAGLVLFFGGWQLAVAGGLVSEFVLPSPLGVLERAWSMTFERPFAGAFLPEHAISSVLRFLGGFGLAAVIGVPLGLMMGRFRLLEDIVTPLFEGYRYVAPLAWVPFAALWFGTGIGGAIMVIFTGAFAPCVINAYRGARLVDAHLIEAAQTHGASELRIAREVLLPGALPSIVAGLRIAAGLGWQSLIGAELIVVSSGIGYVMIQGQANLSPETVMTAMLIIGLMGLLIDVALRGVERHRAPEVGGGMSEIVIDGVSKVFGEGGAKPFTAIEDVEFEVRDREFISVVGPSGCGKTTLMRMVAGLESVSRGEIRVDGKPVRGPGPDRAVVFQQFALFPWKSVRENIVFGMRSRGASRAERDAAVEHYLTLMKMEGTEDRYPHRLSGGMQQRVAIARSYATDRGVLLMDEPFGALDAQTRTIMQEELVRVSKDEPRTVMFITHSVEEAVYLADRVIVMGCNPGRIREGIEVASTRRAERWSDMPIDDVMELESFTHLRGQVWRLLREQMGADA